MSKGSSSKAPNGPFQTSIFTRASTEQTCSMLREPMSRIISSSATAVHRNHARRRVRRERFGNYGVDRQYELTAFGLRFGHDLACGRQEIALAQRFAHGMSACGQEGVGHAAADDESVDFCKQVAEQIELGRYLGSADDRRERADWGLQHFGERLELILHGASGIGR